MFVEGILLSKAVRRIGKNRLLSNCQAVKFYSSLSDQETRCGVRVFLSTTIALAPLTIVPQQPTCPHSCASLH